MKNFLFSIAATFFNLLIEFRRAIWPLVALIKPIIRLKLSNEDYITIRNKGQMANILYAHQPKVYLGKGFEHKTVKLMKEHVKSGMVVFDIGANIGMYSLLLSNLVGEKGTVYAFEPDPDTFLMLNENIKLSKKNNIIPVKAALSSENSFATLNKPSINSGDAFNYIKILDTKSDETNLNLIETITLDDFIASNNINKIDFMKIDIEGAEFLCLQGAKKLLKSNNAPSIVCESNENYLERFNQRLSDLILFMNDCGFSIKNYDTEQWLFIK
jgi:FkbM family methyltransferase